MYEQLNACIARIEALFPDALPKLLERQRDFPAMRGDGLPPGHRLAWMILRVNDMLSGKESGLDVVPLGELLVSDQLLEYWSGRPEWSILGKTINDKSGFEHLLTLMATAHMHEKSGCRIVPEGPNRTGDLQFVLADDFKVTGELKVPEKLRGTKTVLDDESAYKLVETMFKRASTKAGGQLPPDAPALMIIGAFHLGRDERGMVMAAAKRYFEAKGPRRQHVLGVLLTTLTIHVSHAIRRGDQLVLPANTSIQPVMSARYCENPFFVGQYRLGLADEDPVIENAIEL